MTPAERQAAFRERHAIRHAKMKFALTAIVTRLEGNDRALASEVRQMAEDGLK